METKTISNLLHISLFSSKVKQSEIKICMLSLQNDESNTARSLNIELKNTTTWNDMEHSRTTCNMEFHVI